MRGGGDKGRKRASGGRRGGGGEEGKKRGPEYTIRGAELVDFWLSWLLLGILQVLPGRDLV